MGWVNFVNLPPGEIGRFLEGAFAPQAFIWLVIGHKMQHNKQYYFEFRAILIKGLYDTFE